MSSRLIANLTGLAGLLATQSAMANDSIASINLGGLELSPAAWVTMDSEDLYISETQVRVRYQFTNTTSRDENLLISFPLPVPTAQEQEDQHQSGMYQEWDQLQFKTLVNGKPAPLTRYDVPVVRQIGGSATESA